MSEPESSTEPVMYGRTASNDPALIAVCNLIGPEGAEKLKAELIAIEAFSQANQKRLEERVQELLAEMRAEREKREADDRAFRKELRRDALVVLAGAIILIVVAIIAP